LIWKNNTSSFKENSDNVSTVSGVTSTNNNGNKIRLNLKESIQIAKSE
jgi:hypothetical protein